DVKAGWEANNAPVPEGVKLSKFLQFVDSAMDRIQGQKEHRDGKAKEVSGIQIVDEQTIRVQMTQSDYIFPQKLALPTMGIMKADQWQKDPFVFEKPEVLTNGPYKVVKYDKDAHEYAFEANPNWWGDPVSIQRVEVRTDIQESTLYTSWKNDEVDVAAFYG